MRAYERLLKYVKVHTTSDPNSGTHPSTLRQFDLAKILVEELKELGLTDARIYFLYFKSRHFFAMTVFMS